MGQTRRLDGGLPFSGPSGQAGPLGALPDFALGSVDDAIPSTLIKLPERDQQSVPPIGLRQPLQAHLGYHIPKARQDRAY